MKIPLTTFKDVRARPKQERPATLLELFKLIKTTSAASKKKLPLLKLATFGVKRTLHGSFRHDDNVTSISGVEVDYDGEEIPFDDAVATIKGTNLRSILYTTPSHTPEKPRWRILLPTSKVLRPSRRAQLVARVNGLFGGRLAGESFTLSLSVYYGRAKDNPAYQVEIVDGRNEFLGGDCIDRRHDLDEFAIGKPAQSENPSAVAKIKIDWDEVEKFDEWCKSVDDLPDHFPAKGKAIVGFQGSDIDELNSLLAKTHKGHKPYGSWSSVTFTLAMLAKQAGLSDEKIAALLRCDLPCNHHVLKEDQLNPNRAITQAIRNSPNLPLVLSKGTPLDSARAYVARGSVAPPVFHSDVFYEWQGTHYLALSNNEVDSRLYAFLDTAKIKVLEKAKPAKKAKPQNTEGRGDDKAFKEIPFNPARDDVEKVKHALRAVASVSDQLTPPVWLKGGDASKYIACANGLLRLDDGELVAHTPDYFNTSALSFAYNPQAAAPVFLKFLKDLWGEDREAIETLQEMLGYIVSGDRSYQKIFMLVGARRAGKGTIGHLLHKLVGSGSTGSSLLSLGSRFGLQPLINKTLAVMSDENVEGAIRSPHIVQHLLKVSGGDVVTTDRKMIDQWTGVLPICFVIIANAVPALRDSSGALASRFIVLKFTQSFLGREDKELLDKLLLELPGILNWSIEGWRRLQARGKFLQPASGKESAKLLSDMGSPISSFVDERCRVGAGFKVPTQTLLKAFREWADTNGHDEEEVNINERTFGRDLQSVLSEVTREKAGPRAARAWHYIGVKLG